MKIPLKKLTDNAILPQYAHQYDAGMDLFSNEEVELQPNTRALVATGIAMAIPQGMVGLVWDKSGLAVKSALTTLAGVIDSTYRGEIKIAIYNLSDEVYKIEAGQKIAQMLIQPVEAPELEEVVELEETQRGEGGFGSTGV